MVSVRSTLRTVAIVSLPVLLTAGCASQIGGLAPVGGDGIASLRTAATDVLLAGTYSILKAPVCTAQPTEYTCTATLMDGSPVDVQAPTDLSTMSITVDGEQIYAGSIDEVLESAAEGSTP